MEAAAANKQLAFNLFEAHRREFLDHCRWVARRIFEQKGNVTIDDIRDQVQLPNGVDGRVFGAVFNKDDWEKVGYTQTSRKTSHGRPIAVFRFKKPRLTETRIDLFQKALF